MPRDGGAAAEAVLRVRKERLHSTMLVEILALLVFLAMGFALVSRDEMAAQPLLDKIAKLKRDLKERDEAIHDLNVRVRGLEIANEQLAVSLKRFARQHEGTVRANERIVVLPQDQFTAIATDLANKTALLEDKQQENADLRGRLEAAGKGGSDLPNCTVTSGLLISVDLQPGGSFAAHPLWQPSAGPAASQVPGLAELASGRNLGRAEFQRLAEQVQSWGRRQPTPCGFRARVKPRHSNLAQYLQQHRVVARYFYTAW
jgi:hypothetical protein